MPSGAGPTGRSNGQRAKKFNHAAREATDGANLRKQSSSSSQNPEVVSMVLQSLHPAKLVTESMPLKKKLMFSKMLQCHNVIVSVNLPSAFTC